MKKLISILFILFFVSCYVEIGPGSSYHLESGSIIEDCSCYYYQSEIGYSFANESCASGYDRVGTCGQCCDYYYGQCFTPLTYRYCL